MIIISLSTNDIALSDARPTAVKSQHELQRSQEEKTNAVIFESQKPSKRHAFNAQIDKDLAEKQRWDK